MFLYENNAFYVLELWHVLFIILQNLKMASKRLTSKFYDIPALDLCKKLLGKKLCRKDESGKVLIGRIVETEAYPGGTDKASVSFRGQTEANSPLFMKPGTAYVYMTYGMYYCMNISSKEDGGGVLIRALEPVTGLDDMQIKRSKKSAKTSLKRTKPLKDHELCNGPSKMCKALGIDKANANKLDIATKDAQLWVENAPDILEDDIVASTRIGIERSGTDYVNLQYRFYVKDCPSVSVTDAKKNKK